jgi:hypothetical protein
METYHKPRDEEMRIAIQQEKCVVFKHVSGMVEMIVFPGDVIKRLDHQIAKNCYNRGRPQWNAGGKQIHGKRVGGIMM